MIDALIDIYIQGKFHRNVFFNHYSVIGLAVLKDSTEWPLLIPKS